MGEHIHLFSFLSIIKEADVLAFQTGMQMGIGRLEIDQRDR